MENHFCGSFQKDKNIFAKDAISPELCEFREDKYDKARVDIIDVLGGKEKYSAYEVAEFFCRKYGCFQIPLAYQQFYRDNTGTEFGRFEPFKLNELSSYDYEFFFAPGPRPKGEEEVICLLVDYYHNTELEKNYAAVSRKKEKTMALKKQIREESRERCEKFSMNVYSMGYCELNDIIIIGSKDRRTINSIVVPQGPALIEDIEYEIWYFYNHS